MPKKVLMMVAKWKDILSCRKPTIWEKPFKGGYVSC